VGRRGKYLIFDLGGDRLIVHLGMTGRLLLLDPKTPLKKHDHVDLLLSGKLLLRFHDPRRFGAVLPWPAAESHHVLLAEMGPEPFSAEFNGDYLYERSRGRSAAVKLFIMDGESSSASATSTLPRRCSTPASAPRPPPARSRARSTASSPPPLSRCSTLPSPRAAPRYAISAAATVPT